MKMLVLTTVLAVAALSASAANARPNLDIGVNLGGPVYAPAPVYAAPVYEPAPAYYGPPVLYPSYYNGRDRHRNYDWRYWHDRDPRWHH